MKTIKNKRPVIFLAVGIFNTLVDFSFYSLLTSTVFAKDSQIAVAGLVSGTFALICAFTTHAFVTFRGSHVSRKTPVKFIIFTGFGMWVIRPLLLAVFIHLGGVYHWAHGITHAIGLPFSQDFVANTGAFGFMTVIVLLYNYYVYAHYVFNEPRRTVPENHLEDAQQ